MKPLSSLSGMTRRQALAGVGGLAAAALMAKVARAQTTTGSAIPPSGIEHDGLAPGPDAGAVLLQWSDSSQHLRLTQVTLQDQTDHFNELVHTREWLLHPSEKIELAGNLFVIENMLTGAGRILVKLEPLPHARPVRLATDLRVTPRADTGFDFTLLGLPGASVEADATFADLTYSGGVVGRTRVLQQFQRRRRAQQGSAALPCLLSNTWGDRSRDGRITHDFIVREIEAAARFGIEVVQIDDGWQSGVSSNSVRSKGQGVWSGFWATRPDFWKPDPLKFPQGLAPLAQLASRHGLALGLWFAPDSSDDFANWRRDAECLLGLHREFGVRHFKIDGVHAPTATAMANLKQLFTTLLRESGGEMVFDLDVTAALRPGYFGMVEVGPLFVENRYTDRHKYWPHQTLRNLWQLAWWVDPARLRMEFLNGSRNADKYPNDPLAPSRYDPEAIFATVFFSNPLAWFEISNLPAHYQERLPPLIRLWKQLRPELFSGTIVPLGGIPDGGTWTGFVSLAESGSTACALIFRELSPDNVGRLPLPDRALSFRTCEVLWGDGRVALEETGLRVEQIAPLGFLLVRLGI